MKRLSVVGLLFSLLLLVGAVLAPGAARRSLVYHWPVKPFDRQHPIRGAFGDPRTFVKRQPFGVTRPYDSGDYSFHSGIDIVALAGAPVYPVVSGRVIKARGHEISIACNGKRVFQYFHLRGNVELGEKVVAEQTVIGWIQHPWNHVHLTEIDHHHERNPLARGHLEPYADHTTPHAIALDFDNGLWPRLTGGGRLSRSDSLAIAAIDEPAMRVPGSFAGLPQTPALVEWRLHSGHHWSRWHVAADFRKTVPIRRDYWDVYAAGTYQNSPVFERRLYQGIAGMYLFRVNLHASRLPAGTYEIEAKVSDVRGNSSHTTWPLEIRGGS
ncbi:MAG: hypothetical protein QOG85_1387 [Gaiellaceae bacterium]|jgi:hypothetical protein|nr:hypothetical protein [Gaiellaceae bacterium]